MDGCPIVALGADAARQGSDVKASFEAGIRAYLEVLGRMVAQTGSKEPERKAGAILSTMVGALTLSRAVNDPDLARAILDAAAQQVREAAAA
jgi:TetR/AcrR family transcriptional repressor of nem operon